ncbi:amidohydrolase family protein [Nitratireductor aquibiodomus]|uniref:amidohydrolase family protein n=1 Tax=Nitratireductor aquibiodomus TaxID=204799 RepID=UPI003CC7A887
MEGDGCAEVGSHGTVERIAGILPVHNCGPVEALRHATVNNAKIVRMEGKIGQIAVGSHADLLVLEANPLEDLARFAQYENKLTAVIQADRAVRDETALLPVN